MKQVEPTLRRALLVPLGIAAALAALVFRPALPSRHARPPLPLPVAFDELVPRTATTVVEPGQMPATAEGLRNLKTR
jgi:hypothetical protein